MEYSEEVKKLAETLKNSGLAASMKDALKKAQSMLGKKEEPFERRIDAIQTTLQDTKESEEKVVIEESTEAEEEELRKEEVFTTKSDNPIRENQKNNSSKEKKIDLTEVFDVNK